VLQIDFIHASCNVSPWSEVKTNLQNANYITPQYRGVEWFPSLGTPAALYLFAYGSVTSVSIVQIL
jgi:hypothetical protein